MEEVLCNFSIIPFSGMPEEPITQGVLELFPSSHNRLIGTKKPLCQAGVRSIPCNINKLGAIFRGLRDILVVYHTTPRVAACFHATTRR